MNILKEKWADLAFKDKVIYILAIASFILGWVISFIGLFLPPIGIIDNSVIIIFGQALTYSAYGVGLNSWVEYKFDQLKKKFGNKDKGEG